MNCFNNEKQFPLCSLMTSAGPVIENKQEYFPCLIEAVATYTANPIFKNQKGGVCAAFCCNDSA